MSDNTSTDKKSTGLPRAAKATAKAPEQEFKHRDHPVKPENLHICGAGAVVVSAFYGLMWLALLLLVLWAVITLVNNHYAQESSSSQASYHPEGGEDFDMERKPIVTFRGSPPPQPIETVARVKRADSPELKRRLSS